MPHTDSVTCRCGLIYLAGDGSADDPFMRASYNSETGMLDDCKVCRIAGTYRHNKLGGVVTVMHTVTSKTDGSEMVLYAGKYNIFVRTVEDFKANFTKVSD